MKTILRLHKTRSSKKRNFVKYARLYNLLDALSAIRKMVMVAGGSVVISIGMSPKLAFTRFAIFVASACLVVVIKHAERRIKCRIY